MRKLIESVRQFLLNNITKLSEESKLNLATQIAQANEVLDKAEKTQEAIDERAKALAQAVADSVYKEEEVKIDESVLREVLKVAKEKAATDLEEESQVALDSAIKSAEELLESEEKTQEDINAEVLKLVQAIANAKALVVEETEKETEEETETPEETKEETNKETEKETSEETVRETAKETAKEPIQAKPLPTSGKKKPITNAKTGDYGIALAALSFIAAGGIYLIISKRKK